MSHQLFAAGLQVRDIYPKLKKHFYKEISNVTLEKFLKTKFGLWIDTRTSTDNTVYGGGRTVGESGILLQTEKQLKPVMVILHAMCLVLKMQWLI